MKLVYSDMEHILHFENGSVNELVIENKKMFFDMVDSIMTQTDGGRGSFVLSVADRPVEFCRYTDVTIQFAPFQVNRKTLLSRLYATLEKNSQSADNYLMTGELLGEIERYIIHLAEDLPIEINCQKLAIGAVIKGISPEIEVENKDTLEKILDYMEIVRELDHERLFIMINMRTYFSDDDMERFAYSACLHDFKVLLLESNALPLLKDVKRYIIDADLCEF